MAILNSFIYIIIDLFGTYTLCCYFRLLNNHLIKNRKIEIGSYVAIHIASYLIVFYIGNLEVNIIFMTIAIFLLSFNYISSIKRKILHTAIILIIFSLIETIIVLLFEESLEVVVVANHVTLCSKISQFGVLLLLTKFFNSSIKTYKSYIQWYIPVLISMIAIFLDTILQYSLYNGLQLILSVVLMLAMALALIYIYRLDQVKQKNEAAVMAQKIEGYRIHYEQLRGSYNTFNVLRHNLAESFIHIDRMIDKMVGRMVESAERDNLRQYMNKALMDTIGAEKYLIDTHNILIDCIINAKIMEAREKGIEVEDTIFIPPNIEVDSDVITTALNHIFDMVIKEIERNEEKELNLTMRFDEDVLFVLWNHPFENHDSKCEKAFLKRNRKKMAEIQALLDLHHGRLEYMLTEDQIVWDFGICCGRLKIDYSDIDMEAIELTHRSVLS